MKGLLAKRYSTLAVLLITTLVSILIIPAHNITLAQEWRPNDTVEIVLPDSPGGSNDFFARQVQAILQDKKLVDKPVIVTNKPGGTGNVTNVYFDDKANNAHYLRISSLTLQLAQIVGLSKYRYSDFTPLANMIGDYVAFAVRTDSDIKTANDLLEKLKKDPGSLSVGVTAIGGSNHIPLVFVAKAVGADARKVRTPVFKSSGEAMTALLGGHVDMIISSVGTVPAHVEAGKVRALAVSSENRLGGALKDVPTWKEVGIDFEFNVWRGIVGPKGLTASQVAFWDDKFAKVVATDTWKSTLAKKNWGNEYMNSNKFKSYLDRLDDQLRSVLTDLGLAK